MGAERSAQIRATHSEVVFRPTRRVWDLDPKPGSQACHAHRMCNDNYRIAVCRRRLLVVQDVQTSPTDIGSETLIRQQKESLWQASG